LLDTRADLVFYIDGVPVHNSLYGTRAIANRANLLDASSVIEQAALDKYAFVREAWLQRRRNLVYDGDPPREREEPMMTHQVTGIQPDENLFLLAFCITDPPRAGSAASARRPGEIDHRGGRRHPQEGQGHSGGNSKKAADLIETKIVPHFDFIRMTRIAMGRSWRDASPEQQKHLAAEFKTLLVRTYSTALSNYRDQQIDYKPLRAKPDDTEVTVRSDVKPSGSSQPVSIDYEMEKSPTVESLRRQGGGVSLVTTTATPSRAKFASTA